MSPRSSRDLRRDNGAGATPHHDVLSLNSGHATTATHDSHDRAPVLSRKWFQHTLHLEKFHYTIIGLVIFDLVLVFVDLILALSTSCTPEAAEENRKESPLNGTIAFFESSLTNGTAASTAAAVPTCKPSLATTPAVEDGKEFLFWLSVAILLIFCTEIVSSLYAFGITFLKNFVQAIDSLIIAASLFMELYFHFSGLENSSPGAIVVLRIWKIVRAMHAIAHTIQMKNEALIKKIKATTRVIQHEAENLRLVLGFHSQRLITMTKHLEEAQVEPHIVKEIMSMFEDLEEALNEEKGALEVAAERVKGLVGVVSAKKNAEGIEEEEEKVLVAAAESVESSDSGRDTLKSEGHEVFIVSK